MRAARVARANDGLPPEIAVVWAVFALVAVAITLTYACIPAAQLYHVSGAGFDGGIGRALVFVNYSTALAAIAVDLALFTRLVGPVRRGLAALSVPLCAVVAWPGVVEQSDLDAKTVNAVPAVGVAIALGLTILVLRERGFAAFHRAGLRWRIPVALAALVLALPWLGAELGFYLDGVPLLGRLFLTGSLRSQPVIRCCIRRCTMVITTAWTGRCSC